MNYRYCNNCHREMRKWADDITGTANATEYWSCPQCGKAIEVSMPTEATKLERVRVIRNPDSSSGTYGNATGAW
jgi:DNA-directed RNA polymerase subunit RPC12/RpoP